MKVNYFRNQRQIYKFIFTSTHKIKAKDKILTVGVSREETVK